MSQKNDELFERLLKEHGAEELANSFVFPHDLTPEEKKKSDEEFMKFINKRRAEMSPEVKQELTLLHIRYQLEDAVKESKHEKTHTFGHFLKAYIEAHQKSQAEIAKEISIQPTVLSQYINNRRMPSESILVRLEIHSKKLIPAETWCQLVSMQRINTLRQNKELRRKQQKFVKTPTT